ncbi:DUF4180 domain-containing protein [Lentzea sp. NBRC 102530]|uniref:DUF4180 domain-containing protein n=1 Tax=Lentzea sp. NBRC 102530 TaxID=3032201 RepID=UPI0024A46ECC|nr:DUF4180 domain-containing protein [Lentzea sp. NBRC 102530]GLY50014.1 hypothetical protein Lesp01_36700 [Lentzea sp. NBRC 102530]
MPDVVQTRHGATVLMCAEDGPTIGDEQSVVDLIGTLWGQDVQWIALPTRRLSEDFLVLRTRVAGAVVQKFQQYGFKVAVLGDVAEQVAASTALRDFVYESNRGRQLWFVADEAELDARLGAA